MPNIFEFFGVATLNKLVHSVTVPIIPALTKYGMTAVH